MSGRRPKWAMVALRKLQGEKVEAAERSFAILVELAHMERLPKDWEARKELNESVMNRIWGLPKARTENGNYDLSELNESELEMLAKGTDVTVVLAIASARRAGATAAQTANK